jgi:hypothetical protein
MKPWTSKRHLIALLVAISLTSACATGPLAAGPSAISLGRKLDLSSFANSTGPRRDPARHTPEQYGFTVIGGDSRVATFSQPDSSWRLSVTVLSRSPGHIIVSFVDRAGGNLGPDKLFGSYSAEDTLDLQLGEDGLYKATSIAGEAR